MCVCVRGGEGALHTRLDVGSGADYTRGCDHVIQLSLLASPPLCQTGEFPSPLRLAAFSKTLFLSAFICCTNCNNEHTVKRQPSPRRKIQYMTFLLQSPSVIGS